MTAVFSGLSHHPRTRTTGRQLMQICGNRAWSHKSWAACLLLLLYYTPSACRLHIVPFQEGSHSITTRVRASSEHHSSTASLSAAISTEANVTTLHAPVLTSYSAVGESIRKPTALSPSPLPPPPNPNSGGTVSTPVKVSRLASLLSSHPDKQFSSYVIDDSIRSLQVSTGYWRVLLNCHM